MKTANLYAGLDWENIELLIPQQDILDARLGDTVDTQALSIDTAVGKAFRRTIPQAENGMRSLLVIAGKKYRTVLMPRVITDACDAESGPTCRILCGSFARHGIRSVSFSEDKIRYVVDMTKFMEEGGL